MQPNTLARLDDETHRRVNDETLRQQIKQRPDFVRRMLTSAEATNTGPSLVRRLAQIVGLIQEL